MFEIKVREKGLEVRRDIIVFGRRIFSWRDSYLSNERLVYDLSQRTRFIQKYHAVFDEYRGLMRGREVVVVATGSTLSQYHPITNACHIGVNRAFLSKNVPLLDFYFLQDISGAHDYIDEADVYGQGRCVKFYGRILRDKCIIPWAHVEKAEAHPYLTMTPYRVTPFNVMDLSTSELPDFGSVIFSALAFALWMHPERIYLVGCDCSKTYFDKSEARRSFESLIEGWKVMANYASIFYPEVEICSINPVGLKGIFRDMEM